jgi:phage tail protein X
LTDKKALSEFKPVESSDLMPTKVDIKTTPTLELKSKPVAKKEKPLNNLSRDKTGNLNKGSRNDKFPAILGQLRVANGDTLSDMIHKVYGVYLKEYLPLVSKTNHLIDNVDILPVGSVVNFPAIPQANSSFFEKGFWVQFVQKNELKDAYRFVRNYPKNAAPVQILPYWNKNTGLKFIVLLNSLFYDKSSAMKALESIPSDFASEAKILTQWEKGTTFFASLNKRK